jgi:CheY-like chemotaxis protein/nitrogen-specific signal transduction histidine kinase
MEHDPTSFVCFILDQTARKRLERELLARNEQLAQADRIKNEFLANISHELRTPMNAILGMTELALAEELPPTARDYLQTANASAGVLLGLLNDILDLSKLEAGKFSLESSRFSLREMLDETIKSLAIRAYEKSLELSCHVAVDVPDAINADALRLRQVLINLVGNAIKFTEQGEIVVRVVIESRTSSEVSLRFEVTDTGIGISRDDQQRIFAPFTQADASMTRHYGGTGLGLAISAELIGMMGGQIWVDSKLGQGSTFFFTVRVAIEAEPESSPAVTDVLQQLRGIRVLVVDDNETNRQIIDELLRHWGMSPELCPDGPTALAKIHAAASQGQPYPLVILDALMPGMDGFTLASWIKGDRQLAGATVLMMSSAERHVYAKRLDDLHVAAYFEKPITQADLFGAVLRALGIKQPAPSHIQPIQVEPVDDEATLDVLLAEDTLANEKVIVTILERRGHRVHVARNGHEAVEMAREQIFDVVLMDIQMPIMDGFQATAALRARQTSGPRRLPIIAMTAHAMRGDRERCLAAGMDAYIAKPIDIHRLIELVESFSPEPSEARDHILPATATLSETSPAGQGVVDIGAAMKRLGGDANLLREIIQLFFEDSPELLTRVRESAASGKAREAERAAHSLRGLTSNFDAKRAASAAADVEARAKAGRLKEIPELLPRLEGELQSLRAELQAYLQQLSA